MEYKVEKAEKSTVKISITLNHEEWEAAQEAAYNKTKGKYSLPGFRKGKVPMKMLENAYGKGIFYEDATSPSPNITMKFWKRSPPSRRSPHPISISAIFRKTASLTSRPWPSSPK